LTYPESFSILDRSEPYIMKTTLLACPLILLFIAYNFSACSKGDHDEFVETAAAANLAEPETFPALANLDSILRLETIAPIPFPKSGSYRCNIERIYKDSLLFDEKGDGKEFIVKVDKKPGTGKFYSWPVGLSIDSITGSINVTNSQGGYRYTVGFVKAGTKDTCLQDIIISGATYKDGVYVLGNNDTLALPYFNGNPAAGAICDQSGDDDYQDNNGHGNGNDKCEFDAEDHQGKKGRANSKHVKVRTVSGAINLKKTLEEGAFGSANPSNGQGIMVPIYYKLNDKGQKALQKVNVQVLYFNSQNEIPLSLVDYINRRKVRSESRTLITPDGNPRPPLIVITRS
jgi:hypothetical protein